MNLSKTQIKHLKASISHWIRMRDGKRRDMVTEYGIALESPYSEWCALCKAYDSTCKSCPVMLETNEDVCYGTPYAAARDAWEHCGPSSSQFKEAANKEAKFLISLLPKSERKCFEEQEK